MLLLSLPSTAAKRLRRATLAAMLLCWTASFAQDEAVESIRRRAQETVSRGGYQSSLDFEGREEEPGPGRPQRWGPPVSGRSGGARWSMSGPGRVWLYTILAVAGVFLFLTLIAVLRDRRRPASGPARAPDIRPAAGGVEPPAGELLADAERLAAGGRLTEAVHALLLEGIRLLSREFGGQKSSSTSRELLGLYALDERRRRAFGALVLAVESALFGGRPVGPETYRACRGHFDVLAGRAPA